MASSDDGVDNPGECQHGRLCAYKIGDYVVHRNKPMLVFKVMEILEAIPAKEGDHLVGCVLEEHVRKYHGRDLVRVELPEDEQW